MVVGFGSAIEGGMAGWRAGVVGEMVYRRNSGLATVLVI